MLTHRGYMMFDTVIGRCAIAWAESGIVGVALPDSTEISTRARILERVPGATELAAPAEVQGVARDIVALLSGRRRDLSTARLDMRGLTPFCRRVYEVARTIPTGTTLTYGEVARRMGAPGASRAVGRALGRNPFPIIVPCHRVLASGGKLGGFTAHGGAATKLRLLAIEGAPLPGGGPEQPISLS